MQVLGDEASRLERPPRSAVAAAEAAPAVLMEVEEDVEAELVGAADEGLEVVEVGAIVAAGAVVLDGLPGGEQAQPGEAPGMEAREVLIGFGEREGAAHEAVLRGGELRAAAEVHAAQQQRAALRVDEAIAEDADHVEGANGRAPRCQLAVSPEQPG